jgi:serine/threonine protein kinase
MKSPLRSALAAWVRCIARDSSLARDVAIKALPVEFATESNRLTRFHREARALATMNHPNIAAIYGLEESTGSTYLVLELVEGETLADRLSRTGPMATAEVLRIACQIAEALEAANAKGITHRDIKPSNVKVTPEGRVKVLDFGLAKPRPGKMPHPLSATELKRARERVRTRAAIRRESAATATTTNGTKNNLPEAIRVTYDSTKKNQIQ